MQQNEMINAIGRENMNGRRFIQTQGGKRTQAFCLNQTRSGQNEEKSLKVDLKINTNQLNLIKSYQSTTRNDPLSAFNSESF